MAKQYVAALLVRIVLPAALLLSIALRPFGLSIFYLLLYLLSPLNQVPDPRTFSGWHGKVILLTVVVSWILLLAHCAWHATLAAFNPYGSLLDNELLERIMHNLGLVSYQNIDPLMAMHYLAPELVMAIVSLVVYLALKKLLAPASPEEGTSKRSKHREHPFLTNAGKYISLFLIMFSGIMRPSITSGVYFLVFMGVATAWSLGRPLERGYAVVGRCLMAIMSVHVLILIVYQCTWITDLIPPDNEFARYFGLTTLVEINSTTPSEFTYVVAKDGMWGTLASPLIILFTYFVLALETRQLFKPKPKKKSALTGMESGKLNGSLLRTMSFKQGRRSVTRDRWMNATKKVKLIRAVSPSKQFSSIRSRSRLHQDSTGSVIVPDDDSLTDQTKPTMLDEIIAAVIDFFQVLIRSSYIATSITMMAWSIMFHSWITFVFLMWANIVWLCPNQRSFMLKTSPVLVCYAMLLLIAQYIYGMNLTEAELPSNITEVNLYQIGFRRSEGEPCVPLLIKSLFTCMFWITLRQRMQEIRQRRQSAVVADMAAPLQLTVSTAASAIEADREREGQSRLLNAAGKWLRDMCARYWIYVVVIMLFVIGITGNRMTIFRIIYMFLFLSFILVFQLSWYLWRRLMYFFWIAVIIYSMINLILIYIYQFDNFPKTIENYLYINIQLQHDLGLEPYHPADLFVKLLTPTLFLIITIMQVHYFHKDFMALSDPLTRTNSVVKDGESSRPSQGGASTIKDDIPALPLEEDASKSPRPGSSDSTAAEHSMAVSSALDKSRSFQRKQSRSRSYIPGSEQQSVSFREWVTKRWASTRTKFSCIMDLVFLYLEIHLIKIVFISLMLLCVMNVSAMHAPIMILISPALLLSYKRQRTCVLFISTLISVYFMAKMVYQIDYIKQSYFDVNCTETLNDTNTTNNAEWMGFEKTPKEKSLATTLKGYIGLFAILTFHSMVTYRQHTIRLHGLVTPNTDKLVFPEVGRKEADVDLVHCIKYLVNYGFYKFGVEITLICLIGVIGSRMDVYAVFYAIWLLILVFTTRQKQACIWPIFTGFVTILIPIQYMLAVGFLPQFCIEYPWNGDDQQMSRLRTWMFLPHYINPPHATKLIFDYFLLLFCARQLRVFRLEAAHGESYLGGSNDENIGKDWETHDFVNPVPDFLGNVGSWLDVIKRMIFLGMLWVTLAIMFLTGTNRVNIFSMGYLIGSFIFLWQGTDFYLRPKEAILRWWSWLVRYNVCVVVIKTLLQIPGCIFEPFVHEHACWLVQLLGIGCVDKFAGGNIKSFLVKMQYERFGKCSVPQEDIGLAWDGVCFAFLILQRRLFQSYYFYRVIDESKATTILASRGAELIEELQQKQMKQQEDQEMKILEKIKIKMEKIKANQKKVLGTLGKDSSRHEVEEDEDTQHGESDRVPLVRGDSDASKRGYHTPESPTSPRGFHTPVSDESSPPSRVQTPPPSVDPRPPPLTILPALPAPSHVPGGPPSPSSALMTVSLDAYLEPRRISFESPPSSELLPRAQSPEESYPVFSPPPIRRRHTVASPSLQQRTSIISQSSRAEPHSHHTCIGPRDSFRQSSNKRHEVTQLDRPYMPSSPATHQRAIRSGDYYMFEDFDDTDINLQADESSSDEDEPKEMGVGEFLSTAMKKDLKSAVYLRRASAPSVRMTRHLSTGSYAHSYAHDARRQSRPGSSRASALAVSGTRGTLRPGRGADGAGVSDEEAVHDSDVNVTLREQEPPPDSDLDDYAPPPEQETAFEKVNRIFHTALEFVDSVIVSITRYLLKYSRDYRYVSKTLFVEKKALKETAGFGIGIREGSHLIWQPLPHALGTRSMKDKTESPDQNYLVPVVEMGRKLSEISVPEIRILAPSMERGLDSTPELKRAPPATAQSSSESEEENEDDTSEHESAFSLQSTESKDLTTLEEHDDSMFRQDKPAIVHFAYALWFAVLAHTDIVCYLMVFINQIQSATILSIPLPLMVFMWGTLTIPRPTKTFWVTLIAYTEVIVLLKSMFQFEMITWNQKAIPANLPFSAPRIIGIERKSNYALYDLLLLLIIFLHRFMLKSLGLWKESVPDMEVLEDKEYKLSPEDAELVVAGYTKEVAQKYVQIYTGKNGEATDSTSGEDTEHTQNHNAGALEEPGPSKSSDDDHYKVNDDQEPIIAVTTTLEDTYRNCPQIMMLSVKRYLLPIRDFFRRMMAPGARVTADVYAYMFMCDFFNFLVVIFGFAAFGTHQGDGGVQAYIEENKIPIPFLIMLILQFALIITDRALYLRKFILGKILFQYALVIGVHIWMFFVLPFITERTFNALPPPPMWYMIKCVYLLLSAYQIRCGYPRRIIGNFFCKGYGFINMILFRCFMAIPFVFELRTLMDWIWTDSSMTVMDWLKMEDIFASVFLLKCSRSVEDEYPQPRGQKKSPMSKYLVGGGALAFIIAIIWFPLVFFAFGQSVGQPNPPTDVTVKIRIGPFLPVYQMSAQSHNIRMYGEQDYNQLSHLYGSDRTAQTFLSNYMYNDVAVVMLNPISTSLWEISPPELERLKKEAESNSSLQVKFTFVVTHLTNSGQNPPTIEESREVSLEPFLEDGKTRNPEREKLVQLLKNEIKPDNKTEQEEWLNVKVLFPKFVKVFNKGTAKPAYQLMPRSPNPDECLYRNVQLRLEHADEGKYWRVHEACEKDELLLGIPLNDCSMLTMYTFNDKLFPETLNFISGGGIIGLYTTLVFLASRVLRGFFSGIYTKIMFDDLPNVDRLLQLCLDIYLVREALELALEEDLFAKLVFLYRSPETMIKWTRPKEETDEQRALPPS